MNNYLGDRLKLGQESQTCSEWRPSSSPSFYGHNKSSTSPPSTTKVVIKTGRWVPYSSNNIILGLIVVQQMSLWVGLTRRAAETFPYHPPQHFQWDSRAPKRYGQSSRRLVPTRNKEVMMWPWST